MYSPLLAPSSGESAATVETLSDRVEEMAQQLDVSPELWERFQAEFQQLAEHHPFTYQHCLRVGMYTGGLTGTANGLLDGLGHDIGKQDIDEELLNPDHTPTTSEFMIIQHHPQRGYYRLENIDREAAFVAGAHHRWQKEGYGINVEEQARRNGLGPVQLARMITMARLVTVVDSFDATFTRNDQGVALTDEQKFNRLLARFPGYAAHLDWLTDNRIA